MRKTTLAVIFSILFFGQLSAQDYNIGIKIGPSLSFTRTGTDGPDTSIEGDGTSIRMLFGAFVDIGFKENYYFHTGVNYASKRTNIVASHPGIANGLTEQYSHEYLQIPLLLKLYTNEVSLDTKVYFNFGVIPEIRLSTSNDDVSDVLVENFRDFDLAGNIGAGVEKNLGPSTRIFGGLNFNIGFLNMVKDQNQSFDEFNVKSSLLALEFGVKF